MVSYYVLDSADTKIDLDAKSDMRAAIAEAFDLEATRGEISLFYSVDGEPSRYALTINHAEPRNATNSRKDYLDMLLTAYCPPVASPRVTPEEDAYMDACIRALDGPTGRRF
jgi:hypothetical protein